MDGAALAHGADGIEQIGRRGKDDDVCADGSRAGAGVDGRRVLDCPGHGRCCDGIQAVGTAQAWAHPFYLLVLPLNLHLKRYGFTNTDYRVLRREGDDGRPDDVDEDLCGIPAAADRRDALVQDRIYRSDDHIPQAVGGFKPSGINPLVDDIRVEFRLISRRSEQYDFALAVEVFFRVGSQSQIRQGIYPHIDRIEDQAAPDDKSGIVPIGGRRRSDDGKPQGIAQRTVEGAPQEVLCRAGAGDGGQGGYFAQTDFSGVGIDNGHISGQHGNGDLASSRTGAVGTGSR